MYPDGRIIRKFDNPVEITLIDKEELSTDAFVYRFGLPDPMRTLGHDTCEYLEFETELFNK